MTNPTEKAKELVLKFKPKMFCYMGSGMLTNGYDVDVAVDNAKECALYATDEILSNLFEPHPKQQTNEAWQWGYLIYPNNTHIDMYKYWEDVHKEIKLITSNSI